MTSPTTPPPRSGPERGPHRTVVRAPILATIVLFLVALAGGLSAVAFDRLVLRYGRHGPPPFGRPLGHDRERASREGFARELGLSPEQRVRIDSLMDRQLREIRAVRAQVQPRLDSIVDQTRREIDAMLTPEQREKAKALAPRGFGRREGGPPGPGPGPGRPGEGPGGPPPPGPERPPPE